MSDPDEQIIRAAFDTLKSRDAESAPGFSLPEVTRSEEKTVSDRRIWVVFVATAVVGLVLAYPDWLPRQKPAEINFDEYAELVSHEFFLTSVESWNSPSDFLLDPEFTHSNQSH
ncbi:MAG: hypothetical protein HKN23_03050 [Verrucomicrobiales bacterium]|nr:hypothetical protein [Verrucomicrobiales bacterium]